MQQRLSAGKDHLANAKPQERFAMARKICQIKFLAVFSLPDIAHQAAAVTVLVDVQQKNRKAGESFLSAVRCLLVRELKLESPM